MVSPALRMFSSRMSSGKPILYSYWRSSCAWRVRIALNFKGVEYETRTVNLVNKDEMWSPEWIALNPSRKVPVFVHNGNVFTESLAIIEYIDEVFPGPSLFPKDPVARAHSRAIAQHIGSGIQPIQNLRIQQKLNADKPGSGPEWAKYWLAEGLGELEKLVVKTTGKYSVGDELSIADLCLPSILYNARRFNVDLAPFPNLLRIDKALEPIPSFAAAIPDKQPGAVL